MPPEWKLELEHGVVVPDPNWDQIHKALVEMDGNALSMVSLELADKGCLLAGGGDEERFIVVYFPKNDDRNSLTLADLSSTGSAMELTVEGVASGPFPAKWCVARPLIVWAFEQFFRTGELASELIWESDG